MTKREFGIFMLPLSFYFFHLSLEVEVLETFLAIFGSLFFLFSFVMIAYVEIKSVFFWFERQLLKTFGKHIQLPPKETKQIWFSRHGGLSSTLYFRSLVLKTYKDKSHGEFDFKSRALWIPAKYFLNTDRPKPKKIGFPDLIDVYFLPSNPNMYHVDVSFLDSEFFKEIKYHHQSEKFSRSKLRNILGFAPMLFIHIVIFIAYYNFVISTW